MYALKFLLTLPIFLIFTACTAQNFQPSQGSLSNAIEQGYIMCQIVAAQVPEEQAPQIITPHIGTLYNNARTIPVHVYFPEREYLHFVRDRDGEFRQHVVSGQWVREGDVLASLLYDNRRTPILRDEAAMLLTRHDRTVADQTLHHQTQIDNARIALELATDADLMRLTSNLVQLENAYQRFRLNATATRERLVEELAVYNARLANRIPEDCNLPLLGDHILFRDIDVYTGMYVELLTAPFDGYITFTILETTPFRQINMFLPPMHHAIDVCILGNPPIIGMTRADNFQFRTFVDHAGSMYYVMRSETVGGFQHIITMPPTFVPNGTIMHGTVLTIEGIHLTGSIFEPVEAKVASDDWAAGHRQQLLYWLKPLDMDGFMTQLRAKNPYNYRQALTESGFSTTVYISAVDHGLLLPTAAVHPEDGSHFVYVYQDGDITKQYIVVGVLQGGYFHIISGLEPDTKVVVQ